MHKEAILRTTLTPSAQLYAPTNTSRKSDGSEWHRDVGDDDLRRLTMMQTPLPGRSAQRPQGVCDRIGWADRPMISRPSRCPHSTRKPRVGGYETGSERGSESGCKKLPFPARKRQGRRGESK